MRGGLQAAVDYSVRSCGAGSVQLMWAAVSHHPLEFAAGPSSSIESEPESEAAMSYPVEISCRYVVLMNRELRK